MTVTTETTPLTTAAPHSPPPPPTTTKFIPLTDSRIKISGRHLIKPLNICQSDSLIKKVVYDWPGVRVCFAVKGHCDLIKLDIDGGNNYFDIIINKKKLTTIQALARRRFCTIYQYSSKTNNEALTIDSNHENTIDKDDDNDDDDLLTIEIVKRTEPVLQSALQNCYPVSFYGIIVDKSATIVPWSPFDEQRRIEFIGDSDTCGFCSLGSKTHKDSWTSFQGQRHHAGVSFATQTADLFNAEGHLISWSGKGCHSNCWNPLDDGKTMKHLWRRRSSLDNDSDKEEMNEYILTRRDEERLLVSSDDEWMPHLVVVKLGANDLMDSESTREQFSSSLVELLTDVRRHRPDAVILCISSIASMLSSCELSNEKRRRHVEVTLKDYHDHAFKSLNDDKVFYRQLQPDEPYDEEDFAGMMHWNVKGHRKTALALAKVIKEIMEWDIKTTDTPRAPIDSHQRDNEGSSVVDLIMSIFRSPFNS